ncbi:WD40 repeat [Geosmithia morbida]|uniref:WD40 repeat n=1 Tax=Geosmithia morbida TaxID=1094350 RepID=A0A9P4YXQ3_9HYPO|nr:WD40 repeat [Geosmithia morbida]KAF4123727.1 WD40 repeat [Geosmithia morbida]
MSNAAIASTTILVPEVIDLTLLDSPLHPHAATKPLLASRAPPATAAARPAAILPWPSPPSAPRRRHESGNEHADRAAQKPPPSKRRRVDGGVLSTSGGNGNAGAKDVNGMYGVENTVSGISHVKSKVLNAKVAGAASARKEPPRPRRPYKDCLTAQVLPHVVREVYALSPVTAYRLDELAQDKYKVTAGVKSDTQEDLRPEPMITATTASLTMSAPEVEEKEGRKDELSRQVNGSENLWFKRGPRPYIMAQEREHIRRGVSRLKRAPAKAIQQPVVYHVDFTSDEVTQIVTYLNKLHRYDRPRTLDALRLYVRENAPVSVIVGDQVPGRTSEDIRKFCSDILAGRASYPDRLRVLSFGPEEQGNERPAGGESDGDIEYRQGPRVSALLLARELEGNRGFGRMRGYENFQNEFPRSLEDDLGIVAEFTNCAGDVSTISWVSGGDIVCGTTTHSDSHNQQYNKPGNLLLGSLACGRLQAYPDHRIPRPLVEKGENSTEAMRQSQDRWLYSSVVSSDYDPVHKRIYTSSFDGTVKVWTVEDDDDDDPGGDVSPKKPSGKHMVLLATWKHDGNVNFVVAAKDGSGRVASAADTPTQAVRIYTVNPDNIAESPYEALSCSRKDADGTDTWAYQPAALRWGLAPGTQHMLAVGYSPRSASGDDLDIPEEKRDSGEIVLWDADARRRIAIANVTTANVFEIAWHPTLPRFICATSPCGNMMEHGTQTQIHEFRQDRGRQDPPAFTVYQSLDCAAKDVNELTYVPNSAWHAYVTAACTDGRVYVWDTAQPDAPLHVLQHGSSLDGFDKDREDRDTGVKFTAWGASLDRLYTGSSDGVVKVWNVRHARRPLVRTLLEAPAPISSGAFSPDLSRLAIGDATGRVFILSTNRADEPASHRLAVPGPPAPPGVPHHRVSRRRRRRPVPFTPHREPDPPPPLPGAAAGDLGDPDSIAVYARDTYLSPRRLVPTGNPVVGMVQGPNYASTGLYCREAHEDDDPARPLLSHWDRMQRRSVMADRGPGRRAMRRLRPQQQQQQQQDVRERERERERAEQHSRNMSKDFSTRDMAPDDVAELVREGAMLSLDGEEEWAFDTADDWDEA